MWRIYDIKQLGYAGGREGRVKVMSFYFNSNYSRIKYQSSRVQKQGIQFDFLLIDFWSFVISGETVSGYSVGSLPRHPLLTSQKEVK